MKKSSPRMLKFLTELPQKADYFLDELQVLDDRMDNLDKSSKRMSKVIGEGANKLVLGIVIAALFISFAIGLGSQQEYAFLLLGLAILLLLYLLFSSRHNI